MRKFIIFILCCTVTPLWAAPSLIDLDSWQLPEDEPEPVAAPVAKPQTPKKAKKSTGPELKVQLTGGDKYAVASSTRDAAEIIIMKHSAAELFNLLKGKNRFHILLNSNIPASTDKIITAADGKEYALVIFGDETGPYRLLLFKNGVEQPLIATAEDLRGELEIFKKYNADVGVSEDEIKQTYVAVKPQKFTGKEEQAPYTFYPIDESLFVFFKSDKLSKVFSNEKEATDYMTELKEGPAVVVAKEKGSSILNLSQVQPTQKRLFSEIVNEVRDQRYYGPDERSWGSSGRYSAGNKRGNSNRGRNRSDDDRWGGAANPNNSRSSASQRNLSSGQNRRY